MKPSSKPPSELSVDLPEGDGSCRWTLGRTGLRSARSGPHLSRRLLHDRFHLVRTERPQRLRFDITQRRELEHDRRHGFVVWRLCQNDQVIVAKGPEKIVKLHAEFRGSFLC